MNEKPKIESFIFIDLEATGLPDNEISRTKITEISLIHVLRKHLQCKNTIPRVTNKINLCIYPKKFISEEATYLTGLSNTLLEEQAIFNDDLVGVLHCFLNRCPGLKCLVAHNGNKFDFPLFRAELNKLKKDLPENIMCADSLIAFRELLPSFMNSKDEAKMFKNSAEDIILYNTLRLAEEEIEFDNWIKEGGASKKRSVSQEINETTPKPSNFKSAGCKEQCIWQEINETTPKGTVSHSHGIRQCLTANRKLDFNNMSANKISSYKLKDIYFKLFNKTMPLNHQAESDTIALVECVAQIGTPIFEWFDKNCILFNDIKRMW